MRCRRAGSVAVALAAALSGSSCGPQFDPAYLILNERVLAVRADPPEIVQGESATLTPLVVSPAGTLVAAEGYEALWWRCPPEEGDALADEERCSSPERRIHLGSDVPYLDEVPGDLFALPNAGAPDEEPDPRLLGAMLGYWRVIGLTMTAPSGRAVDAVKRVVVYGAPVPLGVVDERLAALDVRLSDEGELEYNTNPLLGGVEVRKDSPDGGSVRALAAGSTYYLRPSYDERELQAYYSLKIDLDDLDLTDPSSLGEMSDDELLARFERVRRCEIPVFSWYVTAGQLARETTVDERVVESVFAAEGVVCPAVEGEVRRPEVRYTAPAGDEIPAGDVVHAWLVMRDGRGGTAFLSFDLEIEE